MCAYGHSGVIPVSFWWLVNAALPVSESNLSFISVLVSSRLGHTSTHTLLFYIHSASLAILPCVCVLNLFPCQCALISITESRVLRVWRGREKGGQPGESYASISACRSHIAGVSPPFYPCPASAGPELQNHTSL